MNVESADAQSVPCAQEFCVEVMTWHSAAAPVKVVLRSDG